MGFHGHARDTLVSWRDSNFRPLKSLNVRAATCCEPVFQRENTSREHREQCLMAYEEVLGNMSVLKVNPRNYIVRRYK